MAVKKVKEQCPEIVLMMVLPFHPADRPVDTPDGFDGTYYPDGLENVPKRYAIVRANRIMVDNCDWLVCYVWHNASNSGKLLEYAKHRKEKGLLQIKNIYGREKTESRKEVFDSSVFWRCTLGNKVKRVGFALE